MSLRGTYLLLFCIAASPALAGSTVTQTGMALQSMCKGADKVRTLSVMCHSYLNGYLDASVYHQKDAGYCLSVEDKARLPQAVVDWIATRPDQLKAPAAKVLHDALIAKFACKRQ